MPINPNMQKIIDKMSYEEMLRKWRFTPSGSPFFEGELGQYFKKRMLLLRNFVDHEEISKKVGWKAPRKRYKTLTKEK